MKIFSHTQALCPECKNIVDAQIIEIDGKVFLKKFCKEHGKSQALTCSDADWYQESTKYIKPGQSPKDISIKDFRGCPESCGLCPEHQQHTCLPVIEITSRCDLNCPICLKGFGNNFQLTTADYENILNRLKECEEQVHVINLSGGEPALHPELEKFLKIPAKYDIMQVTVSTNGLRLLEDQQLRQLFKKTGTIAALQFDGFSAETYRSLRGTDISKEKLKLIELLEKEGIRYSLVSTVVKDINDHEINNIVDFFFKSKALSLMFQPAVFTGNAASFNHFNDRVTIPDVVKEIEKNSNVNPGDFNPLPCSHFSCFALSYYFNLENGSFLNLKEFLGKENFLNIISNRTLPGLDVEGLSIIKDRIYEFWSASDSSNNSEAVLQRIRRIFDLINECGCDTKKVFDFGSESMKAIFIHQFMDKDTLDFGRLIKCCNHYPQADGRLIPMCAQNVFFQ